MNGLFSALVAGVALVACSSSSTNEEPGGGGASSGGVAGVAATGGAGGSTGGAGGSVAGGGGASGAGATGGVGASGGVAGAGGTAGADAGDASTDGPAPVKRIFVTSAVYDGDLKTAGKAASGLAGGDALCNEHAKSLGGTWVAWLSTDTSAYDRVTGNGPWYRVDGTTLLFPDRNALKGTPLAAISTDENGLNHTTNLRAWTGTNLGGTPASNLQRCNGWMGGVATTGQSGNINSIPNWTNAGTPDPCGTKDHRLICIEQ